MRITAIETVQVEEFSNMLWVRVHTDEGIVGLGETFRNPVAIAAYVHETCAPYLRGKDPLQIERHAHGLMHRVGNHFEGFPSRSVEIRGNSAIDLALWDIFGKASGLALHQLLGGLSRERIRIYNTCGRSPTTRRPGPMPTRSSSGPTWSEAPLAPSMISRRSISPRGSSPARCSRTASRR
jgi:galactonate dehydratase